MLDCTVPPEFFTLWVLNFINEKWYSYSLRAGAFQPMRSLSGAMNSHERVFSPKKLYFFFFLLYSERGLTFSLHSSSPRASALIIVSAVARFVATGILCLSQA